MSRALVLQKLREDAALGSLVEPTNILPDRPGEGRPSNLEPGPFIIIRWGDQRLIPSVRRGPREVILSLHFPKEFGETYMGMDEIFDIIENILLGIEDENGPDGLGITEISPAGGRSGDLVDPAFNTFYRTISFDVLARTVA